MLIRSEQFVFTMVIFVSSNQKGVLYIGALVGVYHGSHMMPQVLHTMNKMMQ